MIFINAIFILIKRVLIRGGRYYTVQSSVNTTVFPCLEPHVMRIRRNCDKTREATLSLKRTGFLCGFIVNNKHNNHN